MEALFILGGLFFLLVVPVLAIRANLKLGALERELIRLRAVLAVTPVPIAPEAPSPIVAAPTPSEVPVEAPTVVEIAHVATHNLAGSHAPQ